MIPVSNFLRVPQPLLIERHRKSGILKQLHYKCCSTSTLEKLVRTNSGYKPDLPPYSELGSNYPTNYLSFEVWKHSTWGYSASYGIHTWYVGLTALQLRLTQFAHRFLKCELLLEAGQEVGHLAIIIIIFNAGRKEGRWNWASNYQHTVQKLVPSTFESALESQLRANF